MAKYYISGESYYISKQYRSLKVALKDGKLFSKVYKQAFVVYEKVGKEDYHIMIKGVYIG